MHLHFPYPQFGIVAMQIYASRCGPINDAPNETVAAMQSAQSFAETAAVSLALLQLGASLPSPHARGR